MMGWSFSSWKPLRRPSRESRPAPRRDRSLSVEDLEGRRLLSGAMQSIATLPSAGTSNLVSGPDGDLWLGVSPTLNTVQIDRIGLDGSVTVFPVPVPGNATVQQFWINSLTTGPDGNLWFDATFDPTSTDNQVVIGEMTPTGVVTEFPPIPVPDGLSALASSIVSGPDSDLWFGYSVSSPDTTPPTARQLNSASQSLKSQNFIGQVTTAGAVTLFPISSFGPNTPDLFSVVGGADGNLWFTGWPGKESAFGRMSPSGVVTRVPIGHLVDPVVSNGLNGSLIVTGLNARGQDEVLQVTTAGAITRDKIPAATSQVFRNELGAADGSLWFSRGGSGTFEIGQITASGVATSYNLSNFVPGRDNLAESMALGQDGNLYVLNNVFGGSLITPTTLYRISPSELPAAYGAGKPRSHG
jgi:hypothetical protein